MNGMAAPVVRTELTYGLVRHWQATQLECVWCEHPMAQHVRHWRDGWRPAPCQDHDQGPGDTVAVPCGCTRPVVEG